MPPFKGAPARLVFAIFLIFLVGSFASISAQTLSIVQGDGALFDPAGFSPKTMIALVRDSQGFPAVGVPVAWDVIKSIDIQQRCAALVTFTDSQGLATNDCVGGANLSPFVVTAVVRAAALGQSVNFRITTDGVLSSAPLITTLISPSLGEVLSGPFGALGQTAVRVQVISSGVGVPNVLVRLIPASPAGPAIRCKDGTGFTDATGIAECVPVFGGTAGSGQYTVDLGYGYRTFGPFPFSVTAGSPTNIRITGGDNQSGSPGARLPLRLTARTEDLAGNPVPLAPVFWEPVIPNTAVLTDASSRSDANGEVSATVTLGSTVGPVQVRIRDAAGLVQALFNLRVNPPISGLTKVAGDGQSALAGATFAEPIIVQVNTSQGPVAGLQVQFTSTANVALSAAAAVTDSQGRASVTVRAGAALGPAVVTVSVEGFTVSFNLTVRRPGPSITKSSFFNGAGGQPGGVSPTAVLAIYGAGIAPGLQGCVSGHQIVGPLPLLLSNVTVMFTEAGYAAYAPLYAVCNLGTGKEYVTLQVPADLPLGAASVTVRVSGEQSTVDGVPVTAVSPGIFESEMSDGKRRAVLLHDDKSYVTLENPARRGERLSAFVTGLGRPVTADGVRIGTNQGGVIGADAIPPQDVIVGVANQGVRMISAIYSPNLIGVYVVTFEVPVDAPSGTNVAFAVGAITNETVFGNPSALPIQ